MTVIVGILCSNGVVLGADSALMYGGGPNGRTMVDSGAFKLEIMGSIATATAGSVGLAQRANALVGKLQVEDKLGSLGVVDYGVAVARRVIEDLRSTESPEQMNGSGGWGVGMLMGLVVDGQPRLIEFDPVSFHPEVKGHADPARGDRLRGFATMGSGQGLADPFLAHAYRLLFGGAPPTVAKARLAVAWTLEHVIRHNTGGVGGEPQLAVLAKESDGSWAARHVDSGETLQQVSDLEAHIRSFGSNVTNDLKVDPIDI